MESINEIPKVVQNSDYLYKSDIKWVSDIEYKEPNEYEKEMLKDTKTAEQLLAEECGVETIEMTEECKLQEKKKNLLIIFKVVAATRMGLHPLVNVSTLQPNQYKTLKGIIECLIQEYNSGLECDITSEFNNICNDKLFTPGVDVSSYPVYR